MANIRIETLTPVHIGSGKALMKNTEFIITEEKAGVIDEKKVVNVIGVENIDHWVNIINRGESLWEYLQKRNPGVILEDVSRRQMEVNGSNLKDKKSLKEQLHSAKGLPMIPGSSIKGAIRTAVIAKLVDDNSDRVKRIIDNQKRNRRDWDFSNNRNTAKTFQKAESAILNKILSGTDRMNANKNTFRFLQVSDFEFHYDTTVRNIQIMNFFGNRWDFKRSSDQLTELISTGSTAEGCINIKRQVLNLNKDQGLLRANTDFLNSLPRLFAIVNEHTIKLIDREIELWDEDEYEKHETLLNYIDNLKNIRDLVNSVSEGQAILRIGGGSGWDSITGGWIKYNENLLDDDEYDTLVKFLNKNRDVDYFPKTRKMDEEGTMLGFVKMEIT